VCVGRNYREHVSEMGNDESPWPETFLRLPSTVTGPYDEIKLPAQSEQVDYEGELAVVIGRGGRNIPAAEAERAIFGYTIVNDVSVRDWQRRGQQWTPGKNFDGTLPVGPELVTADELDWRDRGLETRLNGETVQSATTAQFIFDVPAVIEFVSSWLTLEAGDLICTGTPGGVGAARKPPLWLKPGDVVEVEIEGIGTLRNPVVADGGEPATDRWNAVASNR
jgi:2-keto-4-pentenoate hydratase/2-oxohepta-3-ene-1,7-dioic acid hydratase in catechol pathway